VSSAPVSNLQTLLEQSLLAWRLTGSVRGTTDGATLVFCGTHEIRVEPSPPDLPFRWAVTVDGRRRGAISIVAVLRQVRAALDPGYAPMRARVAGLPSVPS
jgi:hypothetical protein